MTCCGQRECTRQGFTIVEVLTALGIIAVLLGLLVPAMSRVTMAGRAAECQSNLRQMMIAGQHYADLYDVLPAALRYELVDGELHQVAWDWVSTMDGELVRPGPLWAFTDHPDRVMQDPQYLGEDNFGGADPYTGFNYNTSYLGGESSFPTLGWGDPSLGEDNPYRAGLRQAQWRRPARTAVFGCGGWAGGANKFMRAPLDVEGVGFNTIYAAGQAFRYAGETYAVYLDGHIEASSQPRRGDPIESGTADPALLDAAMGWPENGFLSDDDAAYDPR